jgi:hypothetical protein
MQEFCMSGTGLKPLIYLYNINNDKNTIMYGTSIGGWAGERAFSLDTLQATKLQNSQNLEKRNDYSVMPQRILNPAVSALFKIRFPQGEAR